MAMLIVEFPEEVARTRGGSAPGIGPKTLGTRGFEAPEIAKMKFSVEDDLSASDAEQIRQSDKFLTAEEMPLTLIKPMEDPLEEAEATPSWGISAIGADVTSFDGSGVKVAVICLLYTSPSPRDA